MERHFPEDLLYTKDHEWCRVDGDVATIGITFHAQDQLGDIVFCELPAVGEKLGQGEPFGVVESTKTVSDLYAPLTGKVLEKNDVLGDEPQNLNEDCYDDGWMIKVQIEDKAELEGLLSAEAYLKLLEDEG